MASGTLAPAFWYQALDDTGVAVPGALVNFFASGTSTRLTAYADAALTVPLSNPQACDSAGRLVIYFSATAYKIIVTTPGGVPIGPTVDPVTATGSSGTGLVGAQLGDVFVFGGDPTSPVTAVAYPSGPSYDKLHAGTAVFIFDSGTLAPGTYIIEATGVMNAAGTLSVALMNLSDGAPDTPLASATITSTTGEVVASGPITFAPAGAGKGYGIKTKVSANSGEVWGIRLFRQV